MKGRPTSEEEFATIFRRRQTQPRGETQNKICPNANNEELEDLTSKALKDEPKVFNLSNRKLTECEVMLLSKGLKYTPTPNENNQKLKTDIKLYTRRLRLTEYFHDSEEIEADLNSIEQEPKSLVRNNSNFNPKRGRNSTLDAVCDTLENINLSNKTKNVKFNLCKEEKQALKDLREDSTIIIKEADKRGGVVIMNKDYYKEKNHSYATRQQLLKKT